MNGKKFKLRSGNKPSFKGIGSTTVSRKIAQFTGDVGKGIKSTFNVVATEAAQELAKKSPAKTHDGTKSSTTHYKDGSAKPKREVTKPRKDANVFDFDKTLVEENYQKRHEELINQGFTPEDADRMIKDKAVTGKVKQKSPLKKPIGTPGHKHPHSDITETRTKDSVTKTNKKSGKSSTYKVTNKKQNKDGSVTVTLTNDKGISYKEVHSSKKRA